MFTGIVEEIGEITSISRGPKASVIKIKASKIFEDLSLGDSIAVDGVCLTASQFSGNIMSADIMNETFNRSGFLSYRQGDLVNLERAMPVNGRFGGHIVSGHIDATGQIIDIKKDDNAYWFEIKANPQVLRYCVEKGSIAINGISLTIAQVLNGSFKVSVIPHTIGNTNLQFRRVGGVVNLECDIIGKYVEKLALNNKTNTGSILSQDFLNNCGF
ncbi:MAG: riboflavin synthase [Oscillospiraceae bacterium]|nr:riboflavin synthase [Oscillospiraceae bacterium]